MTDVIYLAPPCQEHERMWCEHDAPVDCECIDGPHPWIKYVAALRQPTQSDAPPEDGGKLLQDYDNARSTSYGLQGFHIGHGVGKIATHRERLEQAAKVKEARDSLLAALRQPTQSDALTIAASALLADVRRRHPNEDLRCEYMIALDAALQE